MFNSFDAIFCWAQPLSGWDFQQDILVVEVPDPGHRGEFRPQYLLGKPQAQRPGKPVGPLPHPVELLVGEAYLYEAHGRGIPELLPLVYLIAVHAQVIALGNLS